MSRREKPMSIPLFIDAYLAGTMMLDAEQDGCNLRLMMAAWRQPDCALPYDDKQLATIVRLPLARWRKIKGPVLALWVVENGRMHQKRLRQEWAYVNEKRAQTRSAVASREAKRGIGMTSSDASKTTSADASPMVGGERWEADHPYQEEELAGEARARDVLTVLSGGRK